MAQSRLKTPVHTTIFPLAEATLGNLSSVIVNALGVYASFVDSCIIDKLQDHFQH